MKVFRVVLTLLFISGFCSTVPSQVQRPPGKTTRLADVFLLRSDKKCEQNQDNLYNRVEMLEKLGTILDETMISYYNAKYRIKKKSAKNPKFVIDERPVGFFVFDLTETSNMGKPLGDCIEFKNNHVYHFALMDIPYSFSHIVVLQNGNLKIFKAVNCKDGDSLEDVISYLNQMMENTGNKYEILNRVRNYREYGIYSTVDDDSLRCQ